MQLLNPDIFDLQEREHDHGFMADVFRFVQQRATSYALTLLLQLRKIHDIIKVGEFYGYK